ncbi:CPBP family intramembrane glutamic endopeptidase [Timonella sp. A28]|uniref:CPBP family intramembrane glutamic endopeptidase n=1 Tax=Timonella sp. A28 TaxID=3442640 RepID=UPI003EBC5BEC
MSELTTRDRLMLGAEIWIVLGLSLGKSGVYALVNIVARLTADTPLSEQTAAINTTQSPRPYLDLTYQILSLFFALMPVALALFLLSQAGKGALRRIGFDGSQPWRDTWIGVGLAALIGIPGLAFYVAGRAMGITVEVQPASLDSYWWTVPILIVAALKNGLLEEIIAVAYLHDRLQRLGWGVWQYIAASSLLRGSYHLYQGIGPFFGNVAMGVLFAWFYQTKWGRTRVMPLVIAHTILDIVAFVGYALLPQSWLVALGVRA